MPGVSRKYVEHKLHVRPDAKPVKQPLCRFAEGKRRTIEEEITRLLAAGFIMEVFHPGLAGEPSPGAEEEQHMANVHRLHKPE